MSQDYLVTVDYPLLQDYIPQIITNLIPSLQTNSSRPLGDYEKSYNHAITKMYLNEVPKTNYYSKFTFIFSLLKNATNLTTRRAKQWSTKRNTSKSVNFPSREEIIHCKYRMEVLQPYHKKKGILITINYIITAFKQSRDFLQTISFDSLKISQSASCIRSSLDERYYISGSENDTFNL